MSMKILTVVLAILFVSFLSLLAWGLSLPKTHEVTVKREIKAPIKDVWQVLTNWERQTDWRAEVDRIDILNPDTFIEYPKKGPEIQFKVITQEVPRLLELEMSGAFQGIYRAELFFSNGVTTIVANEVVTHNSVIGKIFSKLFFDLEAFANGYLEQLGNHVENL